MADYFYACYQFDVLLPPPGPRQAETSTTHPHPHPWRARLASRWTLRREWRQFLHNSFTAVSVKLFVVKGIFAKVDAKRKHDLVENGLSFDPAISSTQITTD